MKKSFLIILLVFGTTLALFSQQSREERKARPHVGFGALPAVSFDSDLGFQYGAIINLFHYGEGRFPHYDHSLFFDISRFTKGSGIFRMMYDSEKLIRNVRTTVDIAYLPDLAMDFFGFNGYQSVLHSEKFRSDATRFFYNINRDKFRARADFQGRFGESCFGWLAGYSFYHFSIDSVNYQHLGVQQQERTLFQKYQDWGLIRADQAHGGSVNYFRAGLTYDSRDHLAFPTKGIWTEALVQTAPFRFLNRNPHSKFALIHRQYFTIVPNNMVFAYRVQYQTTIGNSRNVPYYVQPLVMTSFLTAAQSQGLGGQTTLRGVLRNRVVGDAFALGNFEWRWNFVRFEALSQEFYIGTNVFFDTGTILRPIEMDLSAVPDVEREKYFRDFEMGRFHSTIGAGLKIGWNENFILSVDFGKALNRQDGDTGLYVGLNYLF